MEEELIKRILPHSDDAERSVIGCMMMNREAIMIASEILTGDEFYRQQMGIVFDSMVELYNEGKPVDFVTLPEKLKEKDVPPPTASASILVATARGTMVFMPKESFWHSPSSAFSLDSFIIFNPIRPRRTNAIQ